MTALRVKRLAKSSAVIAFVTALVVSMGVALLQGEKHFYYDSAGYWALSETFTQNGHFSLLNYSDSVRGYALPFVYLLVRTVGNLATSNASLLVMGFNSALFALIGTVLAPRLAEIAWPSIRWGIAPRLALFGLILIFWHGYLAYPLSDFPALAAALLALVAISSFPAPGWMFIAGGSAALATNFRPAYILLFPIVVLLAAWNWRDLRACGGATSKARLTLCAVLFLSAATLVSLPQSLSEHKRAGTYSPLPGGGQLAGLQYTGGLRLQRYDTFVGGSPEQAPMNYIDPHTSDIIAGLKGGSVKNTAQYVEIVIDNPVTMAGVFLRHVVNGLDLRYATPYIEHLQSRWNRIWRFAGFLIVFLALMRIAWPAARRTLEPARWRYPGALLLMSATSIASAVEVRYMLPVFLLCGMVVVTPGWQRQLRAAFAGPGRHRTLAMGLAAASVFFFVVLTIVSGATSNLRLGSAASSLHHLRPEG